MCSFGTRLTAMLFGGNWKRILYRNIKPHRILDLSRWKFSFTSLWIFSGVIHCKLYDSFQIIASNINFVKHSTFFPEGINCRPIPFVSPILPPFIISCLRDYGSVCMTFGQTLRLIANQIYVILQNVTLIDLLSWRNNNGCCFYKCITFGLWDFNRNLVRLYKLRNFLWIPASFSRSSTCIVDVQPLFK